MAIQQRERPVVVPARIAELDDVLASRRKRVEELFEAFEIERPLRRELIQDGAQRAPEFPRA